MNNPLFDNEIIEIEEELSLIPITRQHALELFSKMTENDFVSMDPFGTMNNFEIFYSFLSENAKVIVYEGNHVGTFTNKDFCLGFWIIDDYKGQNLAYRVSHGFIKKYTHYDYEAGSFSDNPASLRILEKLGFEKIKEQSIANKTIYWFERLSKPMEELIIEKTRKIKI